MANLADVLALPPGVTWFQGKVLSWDSTNKNLQISWRGGTVDNVAYLKSYTTPTVNDKVHGIISDENGMLVWGVEELRPAVTPPTPAAATTVASNGSGTYVVIGGPTPSAGWQAGVEQGPGKSGAYFYTPSLFAPLVGVTLAQFEIQLLLAPDSGPLSLQLHNNLNTSTPYAPASAVYLHEIEPTVSTWVALPLSWASALVSGTAKGIGLASDLYSATVSSGGTLRFTPL